MNSEKKEFGKWWMWILGLFVISMIVLVVLSNIGVFTHTVVERKVFENSYQYSEARKQEIATYEAQLAQVDRKLSDPQLDSKTRADLEAQKASINILLDTAKRRSQ